MNHEKARQRTDLRWDYTNSNNKKIYPIGYCAGWHWSEKYDPIIDWVWGSEDHWLKSKKEAEVFKQKYHSDGHTSSDEACECYKEYQLDNFLRMDRISSKSMHECRVCGTWTQAIANVGPWLNFYLCDDHRNREEVAKLFSVGESWGS